MKLISETAGIERLAQIRSAFSAEIRGSYEHKAKPCAACESPGICCSDAHFVNVRITRLEAAAIERRLRELGDEQKLSILRRAEESVRKYDLDEFESANTTSTYACPLFEKGVGCLVHDTAKPLPCIAHACYEDRSDLPPDELLADREVEIMKLNRRVYGRDITAMPLPIMIARRG